MELRKYFYKSYHAKPKTKFKKILNDDLFFKRSLLLKMALNKNIKINTNYRIERIKKEKNFNNSQKDDNSDDSFENKRYEEVQRKKNLLIDLEKILEKNEKKTEHFIKSFKGLKEENNKFIMGYDDIKIPVEERIKRFIINTMQIFQDNDIEIKFRSKPNKNNSKIEETEFDDLNDLWGQNNAAVKLFKQCPLTLRGEKNIYFYYISNHLGEKLNVSEHKYIKYMKQIKDYLEDIKNDKVSESPSKKERKKTKRKVHTFSEKKLIKQINDEQQKKPNININPKKININHAESNKVILNTAYKLNNKNNNKNNKKEIKNNSKINKSNDINSLNNSNNDSKNKNSSINNNINSTQEFPSKDTININLPGITNYENKMNCTNIFDIKNIKNKIKDTSYTTPKTKNLNNKRNNLNMKKKIYLNTYNNKFNKHKNLEELKIKEELNKCKSSKKFNFNLSNNNNNNRTSFQDTNYTLNRMHSENLSNIKKNSISKINIKKQINNFGNILSRNKDKRPTMNIVRYINNIKIKDRNNNNIIDMIKLKEKNNTKKNNTKILEQFKINEEKEKSLSPIKIKTDNYSLINLYEKAKKNNNILIGNNLNEINEYLKSKGLNNNDVLKGIQFNSDNAFINLKSKTNKLNIEAKTKAFFYGIIPNERRKKLDQLKHLNTKINQIERDYIKTLIDKDLKFKK